MAWTRDLPYRVSWPATGNAMHLGSVQCQPVGTEPRQL